jgi:hypothetical protein
VNYHLERPTVLVAEHDPHLRGSLFAKTNGLDPVAGFGLSCPSLKIRLIRRLLHPGPLHLQGAHHRLAESLRCDRPYRHPVGVSDYIGSLAADALTFVVRGGVAAGVPQTAYLPNQLCLSASEFCPESRRRDPEQAPQPSGGGYPQPHPRMTLCPSASF